MTVIAESSSAPTTESTADTLVPETSPATPRPPSTPTATRIMAAIRWYQRAAEGRLSPCRFYPSCSTYALDAVEMHGTGRGLWLAVRRLVRCRPFGPSGYDPVPERRGADHPSDHSCERGPARHV